MIGLSQRHAVGSTAEKGNSEQGQQGMPGNFSEPLKGFGFVLELLQEKLQIADFT